MADVQEKLSGEEPKRREFCHMMNHDALVILELKKCVCAGRICTYV
jgi:hypothetical protein